MTAIPVETYEAGVLTGTVQVTLTPEQDAARTAIVNRSTVETQFLAFIASADTAIANMQDIIDSPQPNFTNLATALTQMQGLAAAVKQIATTEREHIKKTVALARYVSNNLDSLAGTT